MPKRPEKTIFDLPPEYRFDVSKATTELQKLAQTEPDAVISVTLAELNSEGMGEESDVYLPVASAVALLTTIGEDQLFSAGNRTLIALRIARATSPPRRLSPEPWDENQAR
jgi:hypothetical protein